MRYFFVFIGVIFTSGTDQIFIRYDYYDEDGNDTILVNGSWTIWLLPDKKVVHLVHYSELIRIMKKVKEGKPEMKIRQRENEGMITINNLNKYQRLWK
ncbi:MAG: hypothetical protein WAT37_10265 [Saprospiraceae bacterium]